MFFDPCAGIFFAVLNEDQAGTSEGTPVKLISMVSNMCWVFLFKPTVASFFMIFGQKYCELVV